jgi:hypothetical protein
MIEPEGLRVYKHQNFRRSLLHVEGKLCSAGPETTDGVNAQSTVVNASATK